MRKNITLRKKVSCFFLIFFVLFVFCFSGLMACDGNSRPSDDPEEGSGFEDVIPTPDQGTSESNPEGDIPAGDPDPDYGNGDIPF